MAERDGIGAGGARAEAQGDNYPVDVSWYEAIAFCNKLSMAEGLTPAYNVLMSYGHGPVWETDPDKWKGWGPIEASRGAQPELIRSASGYRLPTEAQWEYACRAGTTTDFSWGDKQDDSSKWGWWSRDTRWTIKPVGSYPPNPWGLYDMHGNAAEWCFDLFDLHGTLETTDPTGPMLHRDINNLIVDHYRVTRDGAPSAGRYWGILTSLARSGFRVVRPLSEAEAAQMPTVQTPAVQAQPPARAGDSRERAIPLAQGRWADGNFATSNDEQVIMWFSFTAINPHYIHYTGDTRVSIQLYDSNGNTVGSGFNASTTPRPSGTHLQSVTPGQTYYLRVYSSSTGSFKIGFTNNRTLTPQ